ncbi:MAG: hypothetical protein IH845_04885 [Nanoarchaeota archaeon]|nr:hypothetical protein [Nanoarchaeota archaeon]
MVRISFDIKRKDGLIILGFVFFFGFGLVVAYNVGGTGGNPAVMGHSVDEMDWNQDISQLCLNGICITNWTWIGTGLYDLDGEVSCGTGDILLGYITESNICISGSCSGSSATCTTGDHSVPNGDPNFIETCSYIDLSGCTITSTCYANLKTRCVG